MKSVVKTMVIVLAGVLAGCGEKERSLYDQVMDIHDEVMPKMETLYKMKKTLQDSIAHNPKMATDIKMEFEQRISQLDAASNSMMVWMREFNPPDQKTDEEVFNKYMEAELVRVKKMREDVMRALESNKN